MTTQHHFRVAGWARTTAVAVAVATAVTLLMAWLAGGFAPKLATAVPAAGAAGTGSDTVPVRQVTVPAVETAAGTVMPVHETQIASRLLARVSGVDLSAGQPVTAGQVLVRLDDADLRARLAAAAASLTLARARVTQSESDERRFDNLIARGAASQQARDQAHTAAAVARAEADAAAAQVDEARTVLSYTVALAPFAGIVVDKRVDVGDTVSPGQVLLGMYDPARMQLVAAVPESLTRRLAVGQPITVRLGDADRPVVGRVSEVVPQAQAASRTFLVKVTGSFPPGTYSGRFGRMDVPVGDEQVLLVPAAAVRHVGQVELVTAVAVGGGPPQTRAVRSGRTFGTDVEILSGLSMGERVVAPSPDRPGAPGPVAAGE